MKLEDLVHSQNEKIDLLFCEYESIMEDVISSSYDKVKIESLEKAGLKLFNFMDRCYSDVEAAEENRSNDKYSHLNDLAGLFCDAFEKTIPIHYMMMRAFYGEEYGPSKNTFSGMQQLLVQVLDKKEIEVLRKSLEENNLPCIGFNGKKRLRMTKFHERILSILFACLSIAGIALMLIYLNIDDSSKTKYTLLSVLVALLGGVSASLMTGMLNLKIKNTNATAGFAVFVIIFAILQGVRIF